MRTLTVKAEPNDALQLHMAACAISGEDGLEADLTTTIGLGGLDLLLTVEKGDKRVREKINLRPVVEKWVAEIEAEMHRATLREQDA